MLLDLLIVLLCVVSPNEVRGYVEPPDDRADPSLYNIGIGISDATGPAAGVNMMGYANPSQINSGIHLRLYSRAFIIDDGMRRVVFVSLDCGMMSQNLKSAVVTQLEEKYGDLYTHDNVMLSGTHTHSGPAGYMQYLLFDITSLGYIQETYEAMLQGIVRSIESAHNSMVPGRMYVSSGELLEASINRSPTAYLNNPEEERAKYEHDTDKTMTVLKFVDEQDEPIGMVNWYAVHPTSMNNTNTLISGDNKGYASQLFEKQMNEGNLPGEGKFVAAFAQSNCGDVSPNTDGPKCQDTGLPCDITTSTCGGRVHNCYALGPGVDMMDSTRIIGTKQFDKAMELFNQDGEMISGPVQFIHQFMDMSNYTVDYEDGSKGKTCPPALGYSFAAGTTDGPGAFDFTQGMTEGNPFWNMIVGFIHEATPEQIECHAPKPILLDTGNFNLPYPWHPRVMTSQIGRVGQLLILPVPGEFTTMAGRRFRDHISSTFATNGLENTIPVLAGLSNVYSHYISTFEEYQIQRYEGASTIFGPHSHNAYLQQYAKLADKLALGETMEPGPSPPDLMGDQMSLLPGVMFDAPPFGMSFGDIVAQPYPLAYAGETVLAKFVSGHPRNDVMMGKTFLTVEKQEEDNSWTVIANDADWDTRFTWERTSSLLGQSEITVFWDIPESTPEGTYRLNHYGYHKTMFRGSSPYSGTTNSFKVVKPTKKSLNIQPVNSKEQITASWWDWFSM